MKNLTAWQTLYNFMRRWQSRRLNDSISLIQLTYLSESGSAWPKKLMESMQVVSFTVPKDSETVIEPCMVDIPVQVHLRFHGKSGASYNVQRTLNVRLVCEREPFAPDPDGKWGVNPVSLLRGLSEAEVQS